MFHLRKSVVTTSRSILSNNTSNTTSLLVRSSTTPLFQFRQQQQCQSPVIQVPQQQSQLFSTNQLKISNTSHSSMSWERPGLKLTKVICTIGPSSDTQEKLQRLVDAGMRIGRLNFSHVTDYSEVESKLKVIRNAKGAHAGVGKGFNCRAALLDTKGPEIRTGFYASGEKTISLKAGDKLILTNDPTMKDAGDEKKVYMDYYSLSTTVEAGNAILLDDGMIELRVMQPLFQRIDVDGSKISYTETECEIMNDGVLGTRKGVNIPGAVLDLPALTEKDKQDLLWGLENDVDYVAASFIRKGSDVRTVIAYMERALDRMHRAAVLQDPSHKRPVRPLVISKIENQEGVDNFDDILKESDAIMVARGDLGVEIPFYDVFAAQKMMVKKCNEVGKPVIVATQMLDSMIRNPRPTRAEVSDVGNAVLDGADCVMLSGETAAGQYPVSSVKAMSSIIETADVILKQKSLEKRRVKLDANKDQNLTWENSEELNSVAASTVVCASEVDADLIIVLTNKGLFAKSVARFKPHVPIMCFCKDIKVARQLQLWRGVFPVVPENLIGNNSNDDITESIRTAKEMGWVKTGDKVVVSNYEMWETDNVAQSVNMRVFRVT